MFLIQIWPIFQNHACYAKKIVLYDLSINSNNLQTNINWLIYALVYWLRNHLNDLIWFRLIVISRSNTTEIDISTPSKYIIDLSRKFTYYVLKSFGLLTKCQISAVRFTFSVKLNWINFSCGNPQLKFELIENISLARGIFCFFLCICCKN